MNIPFRMRPVQGSPLRRPVALLALACTGLFGIAAWEMSSSHLQAKVLAAFADHLAFRVQAGPNEAIRFPEAGPHDNRLGYSRLPSFLARLRAAAFQVERQAHWEPTLTAVADRGLYVPFKEKSQAGLHILDRAHRILFQAHFPERVYANFDAIPSLIAATLLYVENRELLDPRHPKRNPAVEWVRLSKAALTYPRRLFGSDERSPGASTLATQLEKLRHSPQGVTRSVAEKLRQMASASLRAYLDGEETLAIRQQLVVDYLNALPLGAVSGQGEVIGLAAGLQAWFGADFDEVNRLLTSSAPAALTPEVRTARALAYKQTLSLLLALRRPFELLGKKRTELAAQTEAYLRLLARDGVISNALRDDAARIRLEFRHPTIEPQKTAFAPRKAANIVRSRLVRLLEVADLYTLDRLDLTVESSIDQAAQEAATTQLQVLSDPAVIDTFGLKAFRLLDRGDPRQVIYSFSLYERGKGVNWLRVQTNNFDQPFDINDGVKLDLGSTAKLRTLVTYLEIITTIYQRLAGQPQPALQQAKAQPADQLTRWVLEQLLSEPTLSLQALLEKAMERRYSASSGQAFYTGGGRHRFRNFNHADDNRVLSVAEAFRHSVNLVFIRMMRDIVHYYQYRIPGSTAKLLEDTQDPQRQRYLERSADREGRLFLARFYDKYAGQDSAGTLKLLLEQVRLTPSRLATILRYMEPEASIAAFGAAMDDHLTGSTLSPQTLLELYERYAPQRYTLADRGYLSRLHPLELWLAGYLSKHPQASLADVIAASGAERIAVYQWLFRTRHKNAQDRRIRDLLEVEAFLEIHRRWQALSYPFASLVPSYATAIGSSADRPAALAELMGILLNDGVHYPTRRIVRLRFAEGTPYETTMVATGTKGKRVMASEIATVVRQALAETVLQGTAQRARNTLRGADGTALVIGGKTGTGDHRHKVYGPHGRLIDERAVNRTATFVYFIGERFYGTVTAHVLGPDAAHYGFTSSLPVQLFRLLVPSTLPLIEPAYRLPQQLPRLTQHRVATRAEQLSATKAKNQLPNKGPITRMSIGLTASK
ncbi:MAG: transglycosylase domain-containing protein [Gammaproteobacteria bacterium]